MFLGEFVEEMLIMVDGKWKSIFSGGDRRLVLGFLEGLMGK